MNNGFNRSELSKEVEDTFNVKIDSSVLKRIRGEDGLIYRKVRAPPKLDSRDEAMRFI
jgi:hypothetical protein